MSDVEALTAIWDEHQPMAYPSGDGHAVIMNAGCTACPEVAHPWDDHHAAHERHRLEVLAAYVASRVEAIEGRLVAIREAFVDEHLTELERRIGHCYHRPDIQAPRSCACNVVRAYREGVRAKTAYQLWLNPLAGARAQGRVGGLDKAADIVRALSIPSVSTTEGVGTGAGEDAPRQVTGSAGVTRSVEHEHDTDGDLLRSLCGICCSAYIVCEGCGTALCDCSREADRG